jgi:hypothetical protein
MQLLSNIIKVNTRKLVHFAVDLVRENTDKDSHLKKANLQKVFNMEQILDMDITDVDVNYVQ